MNKYIIAFIFLSNSWLYISQIVIEETKPKKVKEKKAADSLKVNSSSSVYFATNWSKNNRMLKENEGLFGDSLGKRAEETPLNTWSFGLGIQNDINSFLFWDGGLFFHRNGEQYNYESSDSTYAYQTQYSYISMPIRINYYRGDRVRFSAGLGLVPQMFAGYKQERQWTTSTDAKESETVETKSGYNSFVISSIFNVSVQLKVHEHWMIFVSPEAKLQLNSTYLKQDSYIHKNNAYGVTFGLIRKL